LIIEHPLKLISAILIVGAIGFAAFYWSSDGAKNAAYDMDQFLAVKPTVATSQAAAAAHPDMAPTAAPELGSVAEMLEGLKRRLQTDTDDVDGWILLAKSYFYLNRQAEAQDAFEQAQAAGYTGNWKPLPRIDSAMQSTNSAGMSTSDLSLENYSAEQLSTATNSLDANRSPGIKLQVSLAPDLQQSLPPETAVYVFARNVDGAGPPLAVVQKKVRDLPLSITLDDSDSMMPERNISSAERVIVGARVSISGGPIQQDGDFEQLSDPVSTRHDQVIELNIRSNKS
jgi:cytochrome c-type biogenesis protein CcmH